VKLEINMVVSDAKEAASYYSNLFNAEILSITDEVTEMNEAMIKLGNTEIHILNENKDYGLIAPSEDSTSSMWLNLYVENIESFFENIVSMGCKVISSITDFPDMPAKNAVISDKFNHIWIINQKYD
jgi:uncharacterized glyoxalase superfamily protein PhnB